MGRACDLVPDVGGFGVLLERMIMEVTKSGAYICMYFYIYINIPYSKLNYIF